MPLIDKLILKDMAYLERWTLAKTGDFIQTTYLDAAILCIRTNCQGRYGKEDALFVVDGADRNFIIPHDIIGASPAIVVNRLIEVIAEDVRPFEPSGLFSHPVGTLFKKKDAEDFYVRSQVKVGEGDPVIPYYVCVSSQTSSSRGKSLQSMSPLTLAGIARSFRAELKPEPVRVIGD